MLIKVIQLFSISALIVGLGFMSNVFYKYYYDKEKRLNLKKFLSSGFLMLISIMVLVGVATKMSYQGKYLLFVGNAIFLTLVTIFALAIIVNLIVKVKQLADKTEKKRAIGVTILGSLNTMFFGFITFLASIFVLFMYSKGSDLGQLLEISSPLMIKLTFGYAAFMSLIFMITGNGVLKLKNWARIATIYFAVFLLISTVAVNFKNIISLNFNFLIGLIYPVILLYYFTRPKVKKQFR